jgi:hypothetical protein
MAAEASTFTAVVPVVAPALVAMRTSSMLLTPAPTASVSPAVTEVNQIWSPPR